MKKIERIGQASYSLFIAEDHPIFRRGLVQLIESDDSINITVTGESDNAVNALSAIRKLKPDMAIIDISLKESSGIDLIKDIRSHFPDVRILALSMHDENIYAERALRAGAMGYLMKQEAPETVVKALKQIADGRIYVSDKIAAKMLSKIAGGANEASSPVDQLSDRELEVFSLIGEGHGTRSIAEMLHVSIKTVENHRAHIKEKLGLANSIELVQHATLWIRKESK